jgi:DNA uptake protein ComE-like DNA-binding protein
MDPMIISRIAALVLVLGLGTARVAPIAIAQSTPPKHVEIPEEQRVDINHASLDELLKVPGITKSWAGRIVRFRPYRTKQDLLDKGVVSGEVYNRVKDCIIAHRKDSN